MIGLDGIVRARRIGRVSTSGEDARDGPITRAQITGQTSGTDLIPSPRDGVMRYVSHRRLRDYPLFVAYGVPAAEVLAAPRPRARIFFAGAALLSLLLIAFAALLTSSSAGASGARPRWSRPIAGCARRSVSARSATGITI